MRTFDWIFDKDGNVKKDLECVYDRHDYFYSIYDDIEPQVVKISGYWPYFTDGTPDPTREEVDELCWIECDIDQLCLAELFPIVPSDVKEVLYNGYVCKVLHKFINRFDEPKYILDLKRYNGTYITICEDDIEERREIDELNEDDMRKLFSQITRGSINLSDYHNTLGVPCNEVMDYCDGYYEWLNSQYEHRADDMDNINSFLTFAGF